MTRDTVWSDSWVYNTNTRQFIHPPGRIYGVSLNGIIFGRGNNDRAFAWIPGRGAMDIGANVDTPLSEDGWEAWVDAIGATTTNYLVGRGWLAGTSRNGVLVYLVRLRD